jgi:hypothetical protein
MAWIVPLQKQSQFDARIVQNEPNLVRPKATPEEIVRNEPNLVRPEADAGGNCAKRSQTWGDSGIWAKAVVLWRVARPESKACKTNPIQPRPGNETCKTNPIGPAGGGRRRELCKTNPVWSGGGRAVLPRPSALRPRTSAEGACAKRSQFLGSSGRRGHPMPFRRFADGAADG